MGVKTVGQIDCVKLPEIVVSPADSSPTQGQKVGLRVGTMPYPRDTTLVTGGWDVSKSYDRSIKRKSNQSTLTEYSVEDDFHHNGTVKNTPLERSKKNPLKAKRSHSDRYQSYEMKSRGSTESAPATNGICCSKSFAERKQADHLRGIQSKSVCHATRSDTFLIGELITANNEDKRRRKGSRGKPTKLGDTKALIEKYINPSAEESLAYYQSDLSFLSWNRTGESGLKRSPLWRKTKDKTPEELNMLDLGNSYTTKRKSSEKTLGILQERNVPVTPRRTSFDVSDMGREKTPAAGATAKRVIFNEDSTKVMDVVEVEPTLEFAERLGRRDSEGSSLTVRDRDSLAGTPVSRSSELKPILKNTGSLQQGQLADSSSTGWSECYQDSSDSDSDSDDGVTTPLSSRQPLRLPTLGWSASSSLVSSPPSYTVHSPGFGYNRSATTLPLRSRTLSEIPIRRNITPKKKQFQCSKEFAHVLKNLDSDDEDDLM